MPEDCSDGPHFPGKNSPDVTFHRYFAPQSTDHNFTTKRSEQKTSFVHVELGTKRPKVQNCNPINLSQIHSTVF